MTHKVEISEVSDAKVISLRGVAVVGRPKYNLSSFKIPLFFTFLNKLLRFVMY